MFKIVTAGLGIYSFFLIQSNIPDLPSRIPTHFNLAGQPDGWGSPQTLWILFAFQVLVACVMLSISIWGRRFPGSVHLGTRRLSDFALEQRERVWPLLDQMAGWMSVATSFLFVYLIREVIEVADSSDPRFHHGWAPFLFVAAMAGIALYYVRRINKVAGAAQERSPQSPG